MLNVDTNTMDKCLIRSVSGGALYALADGVTQDDIRSTLSAKLSQLHAMLV